MSALISSRNVIPLKFRVRKTPKTVISPRIKTSDVVLQRRSIQLPIGTSFEHTAILVLDQLADGNWSPILHFFPIIATCPLSSSERNYLDSVKVSKTSKTVEFLECDAMQINLSLTLMLTVYDTVYKYLIILMQQIQRKLPF